MRTDLRGTLMMCHALHLHMHTHVIRSLIVSIFLGNSGQNLYLKYAELIGDKCM